MHLINESQPLKQWNALDSTVKSKPVLLFVGAFPSSDKKITLGNVTACRTLLESGLGDVFRLVLLDSTMRSIPPPSIAVRVLDSMKRICWYLMKLFKYRPGAVLIFASSGLSFLEKSFLALIGRICGRFILFFPRGGKLIVDCRKNPIYSRVAERLLKINNIILCQGPSWFEFCTKDLGLAPDKCPVVPNWSATPSLIEIGRYRSYQDAPAVTVLFLSRVIKNKGIFDLIESIRILSETRYKLQVVVAGEGEHLNAAKQVVMIKKIGNVRFIGGVEGATKQELLAKADIFCLPSYWEGFPNALIEAMAVGLPVVTTAVGAVPDYIKHEKNGLLVEIGNPEDLANNLDILINSPILREKLGRAAHKTAAEQFSARNAIFLLENIIKTGMRWT